jgi:hypothetical protein
MISMMNDLLEVVYWPWIDEYSRRMMLLTGQLEDTYGPLMDEYTRGILLCYFWPSFLMGNIDSMLPEEILKLGQA